MNLNLSNALKTAKNVITANSPVLLVGTAIAGTITTGVLAARGGYKARGIIDEAEEKRVANDLPPLTIVEKGQLTWLCFAAPALAGASTIAATVGVHTIHTKRHAALAGLYAVASNKVDDLQEKAEELLGTKKNQTLEDAVAQKAVDSDFADGNDPTHEVIITGQGKLLCREELTKRYFDGDQNTITAAVNTLNAALRDGSCDLNDMFDHLGIEPAPMGAEVGWPAKTTVSAHFGGALTPDGRTVMNVRFHPAPKFDYDAS